MERPLEDEDWEVEDCAVWGVPEEEYEDAACPWIGEADAEGTS
jgi:hypothetical protein